MTEKTCRIHGRLTPAVFQRYEAVRKSAGFDGQDSEFLDVLLTQWEDSRATKELTSHDIIAAMQLKAKDETELEVALQEVTDHTRYTFFELLYIGLWAEIRRTMSSKKKMVGRNMQDAKQRRGIRGSAHALLQTVLAEIMQANVEAVHWYEKVYITKTVLLNRTKVNRQSVNEFYDEHVEMIDAHHQEIGFPDLDAGLAHNRHAAVARRHAAGVTNESETVCLD